MIFAKPYTLQEQPVQALLELDKDKFHTAHEVFYTNISQVLPFFKPSFLLSM